MAGLLATTATARGDDRLPQVPELEVQKYILPNGLEVVLHEDHTTPVVGVNIWYKVGSKNEKTGRTGFAHLFEHLMFQGSQHHDSEYFGPIEKLGANINGSTNTDRTNYFETLPSNALELALWLESDRMGFLLPALTQAKLDNQRDVVKNERRQRVDNVPGSQAGEKLEEALYPPEHPYHHSVIGSMADLSAASLSDVSAFFRMYYSPNNASLVIAGDIDVPKTKALVEKYFGPIPRGPAVPKLTPEVPVLSGPKHLTMTDSLTNPRTQLVWPTVARGDKDEQALTVLAQILGGGGFGGGGGGPRGGRGGGGGGNKQSRLFLALMYNRQLAASANASGRSSELAGTFEVSLSARPNGPTLDDLIKIADGEIEKLKKDGPSEDEVQKVKNALESRLVMSLEAAGRKADFLNRYNVEDGDPLAYKKEMVNLFAVTPADVKRVANKYLTANRIRVDVNPGDAAVRAPEVAVDLKSQAPITTIQTAPIVDSFDRSVEPKVGQPPKFTPPPVVRRKLSNGMDVLIAERHELPILSLELVVKGGETLVPADKHGLAGLTASLLTEGTTSRDSLKLSGELADIAATLAAQGGLESSSLTLTTLTKHSAKALELFSDVLLNPTFPARELTRLKTQRQIMIRARADRAEAVASTVFPRLLYGGDHPYGRPDMGTTKSIGAITRDDVVAFHKRLYLPNNASLVVVGDIAPDAIVETLEKALKDWKPGEAVAHGSLPEPPTTTSTSSTTVYLVNKPSAAQTVLAVGQVGLPRSTPDYVPVMVMNGVLGGMFSSRINLNLREDKGYTYGARSSFAFRRGPGPFEASAPVQTVSTKEALSELIKELTDITGPRPVTDAELAFSKDRIIRGLPSRFETTMGVATTLTDLVLYNLPDDYFTTYPSKVEAVTKADVDRVAKTYLDPQKMTILVVGDKAKIEGPLKSLPFVKVINVLDTEGNTVPASTGATEGGGR
jgi:zinc protease